MRDAVRFQVAESYCVYNDVLLTHPLSDLIIFIVFVICWLLCSALGPASSLISMFGFLFSVLKCGKLAWICQLLACIGRLRYLNLTGKIEFGWPSLPQDALVVKIIMYNACDAPSPAGSRLRYVFSFRIPYILSGRRERLHHNTLTCRRDSTSVAHEIWMRLWNSGPGSCVVEWLETSWRWEPCTHSRHQCASVDISPQHFFPAVVYAS